MTRLKHIVKLCMLMSFLPAYVRAQQIPSELKEIVTWPYNIPLRDSNEIQKALQSIHPGTDDSDSSMILSGYIIQKSREINYKYGIASGYLAMGRSYIYHGQFDKAIEAATKTLELCRENGGGTEKLISKAHNTLGMAYYNLGFVQQATDHYFEAIRLIEKDPAAHASFISLYTNLATVVPDSKKAMYYLDKSYAIARADSNFRLMGIALQNQSVLYLRMKDTFRAAQVITESYQLGIAHNDFSVQYMAYITWCNYYMNKNEPRKALDYILQARKLTNKIPEINVSQRNAHLGLLGAVYLNLKDYGNAEKCLLEALAVAKQHNIKREELILYQNLSRLYHETGRDNKAYQYQNKYITDLDSLSNEKLDQSISLLEVQYRTAEKDREIAAKEKQVERKNAIIAGIIFGIIMLLCVFFIYYRNTRQKQRMLRQEKEINELKAAMNGEEQERIRIARELHDGIMVQFSSVKMNLSSMLKRMENKEYARGLNLVIGQLDDATRELRRSAHNLMPDTLLAEGLIAAIRYFCFSMQQGSGIEIDVQVYGSHPVILPEYELMLFRIIQELVQNAVKHAKAQQVIVQLDMTEKLFTITVEDDGIGFDKQKGSPQKGSGLNSIRSRIVSLGGHFDLQSKEGTGTTVYIELEIAILQFKNTASRAHIRSHS